MPVRRSKRSPKKTPKAIAGEKSAASSKAVLDDASTASATQFQVLDNSDAEHFADIANAPQANKKVRIFSTLSWKRF